MLITLVRGQRRLTGHSLDKFYARRGPSARPRPLEVGAHGGDREATGEPGGVSPWGSESLSGLLPTRGALEAAIQPLSTEVFP